MPRSIEEFAVFAAPAVFVLLWSSGFVGAKFGIHYAEPLTYLALRMLGVLILLGIIIALTRPKWPDAAGVRHSAATGLMVHGLYLGGVFVAIGHGLSAGLAALFVSLQPILTSTIATRWLGERVVARQWLGLGLGLVGVYLVLRDRTASGGATPIAWLRSSSGFSASPSARSTRSVSAAASTGGRRCSSSMAPPRSCSAPARWRSRPASCSGRRHLS